MSHLLLTAVVVCALPPTSVDIDAAAAKAMEQWRAPGLALVVVSGDKIVHLKGYGVASLESKEPVSADTIFPLASCTKPLTATLLAMLSDDGAIDWDDPVRKHLADFHLKDPLADERVTLRDLLCHRTGVGPHPLLWYRSPLSVEERVRRLALLEPAAEFRKEFHYQTIAFGAAGLAGAKAAGKSWSDLMGERLLRPLGMNLSSAAEPNGAKSLAQPHRRGPDGNVRSIPRYRLDQPDPAGSVHCTARDMAGFLRLHLGDGVLDGKRLVSARRIGELRRPNVDVPDFGSRLNPETKKVGYGLGWIVQDYRGKTMILHGGAIDGFRAHVVLVPDAKLGIAILSNLDGSLCNYALANTLVDLFLDAPARAWNDELLDLERLEREFDAKRAAALRAKRPADAAPLRPLADYAGDYEDAAYGPCAISVDGNRLALKWRNVQVKLDHYDRHVFLANEPPFRDASFEFVVAGDSIASVRFLDRTFVRKK